MRGTFKLPLWATLIASLLMIPIENSGRNWITFVIVMSALGVIEAIENSGNEKRKGNGVHEKDNRI